MTESQTSAIPQPGAATPGDFFRHFFGELEKRGIRYAVLHSYARYPEVVKSDVDYAVRDEDLALIGPVLEDVAQRLGWVVAQTLNHEPTAFYAVIVSPTEASHTLKLDLCSHYMERGDVLVPDTVLLEDVRRCREFFVPSPASEFVYLVAKALAKKKEMASQLSRLRELWQMAPERSAQRLKELLGEEMDSIQKLEDPRLDAREQERRMRKLHPKTLGIRWKECLRLLGRLRKPCGLSLAFLGPDGVGKSTLLSRLEETLEPCFRSMHFLHFRPRFFEKKGQGTPVDRPQGAPPRSTLASWLKVLWYFADHLFGFWFRFAPKLAGSACVVFDRNFDDLLVDPKRYRLQNSTGLVVFLRRFLPKPDLAFVLDADPERVHRRKAELPLEEIARQREVLLRLAGTGVPYRVISADAPPEAVAQAVFQQVTEHLAKRHRSRL